MIDGRTANAVGISVSEETGTASSTERVSRSGAVFNHVAVGQAFASGAYGHVGTEDRVCGHVVASRAAGTLSVQHISAAKGRQAIRRHLARDAVSGHPSWDGILEVEVARITDWTVLVAVCRATVWAHAAINRRASRAHGSAETDISDLAHVRASLAGRALLIVCFGTKSQLRAVGQRITLRADSRRLTENRVLRFVPCEITADTVRITRACAAKVLVRTVSERCAGGADISADAKNETRIFVEAGSTL